MIIEHVNMQSRQYPGIEETVPGIYPGIITFGIPGSRDREARD